MVVIPGTARPGLVAAAAVAVVVEGSDPPRSSDLILAKGRRSAGSASAISESAISWATHVLSLLMLLIESKDKLQSSASCRQVLKFYAIIMVRDGAPRVTTILSLSHEVHEPRIYDKMVLHFHVSCNIDHMND